MGVAVGMGVAMCVGGRGHQYRYRQTQLCRSDQHRARVGVCYLRNGLSSLWGGRSEMSRMSGRPEVREELMPPLGLELCGSRIPFSSEVSLSLKVFN